MRNIEEFARTEREYQKKDPDNPITNHVKKVVREISLCKMNYNANDMKNNFRRRKNIENHFGYDDIGRGAIKK